MNCPSGQGTLLETIGDHDQAVVVGVDADAAGIPPETRIQRRTDRLASRARWQYHDRDEAVFTIPR